jgi:gamma-glutamyltranspeptidase / glutathione hydrolase
MAHTSLESLANGYVPRTGRVAVAGRNGMVSSAHPLASMAGLRVLLDGGNAVDAIVAIGSTLNVVEPWMSGALGVGQMLIYQARDKRVDALDFGGRSPAAATPAVFAGQPAIQKDDIRTPLVPANLGGWLAALDRFGSMDRARVFRDAIDYAEGGYPLTEGGATWIAKSQKRLARYAVGKRIFVDRCETRPGAIFRQPEVAESYRRFAAEGADALYRGEVGAEIARFCQEAGGLITREDLANLAPRWTEPIRTSYRGYDVLTMPPPSMGMQILQTLNLLGQFDVRGMGHNSADALHTLAESIKLASVDRAEYATRPDAPLEQLLSQQYAAQRARLIDPRRAAPSPGERWVGDSGALVAGRPADPGHTTFLCAMDRDGNAVSLTHSLGNNFGCGAVAGETGLLLNDFAWWFDLDTESPNVLAPNKPVEQCLSPCQVFRDGELRYAIGTPGGHGILQTTTQMLVNLMDFEMNVQEAIEAPRIRAFQETHIDVEERIPAHVRGDLEDRGHVVTVLPPYFWGVGGGHGIARDPSSGAYSGGADPRREGYALGW